MLFSKKDKTEPFQFFLNSCILLSILLFDIFASRWISMRTYIKAQRLCINLTTIHISQQEKYKKIYIKR